MTLTPEQRIEYGRAVWAAFLHRAHTDRIASSAEWLVISRWMTRGLPLIVVLRGINDFVGQPRRLEAVVNSVEKSRDYWAKAMGGLTPAALS